MIVLYTKYNAYYFTFGLKIYRKIWKFESGKVRNFVNVWNLV